MGANKNDEANLRDKPYISNTCTLCNAWRGELGLEPTFLLYIQHLIRIFDEVKRVLKKSGTCFVNLGDSYSGGKGQSGCGDAEYQSNRTDATLNKPYHQMGGHGLTRITDGKIGIPPKSLCLIPQRFAIAMVDSGWICRNVINWIKPNAMPESAKDRFTDDYENIFFFVKSKKYYFQQQFEDSTRGNLCWSNKGSGPDTPYEENNSRKKWDTTIKEYESTGENLFLKRNRRTSCVISTEPSGEKHFATYPEDLIIPMIKAGCPVNGMVLDPFAGIGTTGIVAKKLNCNFVGIELSVKYFKIAERRINEFEMLPFEEKI